MIGYCDEWRCMMISNAKLCHTCAGLNSFTLYARPFLIESELDRACRNAMSCSQVSVCTLGIPFLVPIDMQSK